MRLWAGFWWTIHAHVVHLRPSPRPGEASERACVFSHFFFPLHTCKCIESNPPYK
jgi:hypothetical protein